MQHSKRKKPLGPKNKRDTKGTGNSDVPSKYQRNDKNTLDVFQKVQINTNIKTKSKKKNKKGKQNVNLDHASKDDGKIDNAKDQTQKLQILAKNFDLERRKIKVKKLEKINEKKIKQMPTKIEAQAPQSNKILKLNKHKINIKQLEEMLAKKSQPKQKVTQLSLRDRMMTQLRASRFRFINEILYSSDSSQSIHYFKEDPDAFMAYHAGYKQQVEQWTVNPLDVIISSIKKLFV